jgi:hypothetical protein
MAPETEASDGPTGDLWVGGSIGRNPLPVTLPRVVSSPPASMWPNR